MTDKERNVYEYVKSAIRIRGISPTVRDIMSETGLPSTSSVYRVLASLEEQGLISRRAGMSRSISIDGIGGTSAESKHFERSVRVPVMRDASFLSAGLPSENIEGYIDFPLMGKAYGANTLLAVRASDNEATELGILKGDIVIIKKAEKVLSSEIALMLKDGKVLVASPENEKDDTIILGKVISVMRFYRDRNGRD